VIQSSDVFPEKEEEIMFVIGELVNRACRVWFSTFYGLIPV
jgi:hypothetical protein